MPRNATSVRIGAWSAWLPFDDRHVLVDAGGRREADTPDIGFLPVTQRKRLSMVSKIGLCLADHTVSQSTYPRETLANVFATRYGEYQRTDSVLESIIHKTAPAPAAFSCSVHNTMSGLWSIAARCLAPSTTVSAGEATLHAGLLEAAGIASESDAPVLLVYADVPLPRRYEAQDRIGAAAGFAAIVEPACASGRITNFALSCVPSDDPSPITTVEQVAELVELLAGSVTKFRACDGRVSWDMAGA